MKYEENSEFEDRIKKRFDESVSALDASTLSHITSIRNQVLDEARTARKESGLWLPAGAFASICMAVLIYGLVPAKKSEDKTFVDEIDIISELELYENLEFYEWLEQHELPS
jgi:hypothetical protein